MGCDCHSSAELEYVFMVSKETPFWGCRECDYDLCGVCYKALEAMFEKEDPGAEVGDYVGKIELGQLGDEKVEASAPENENEKVEAPTPEDKKVETPATKD